MKINKPCLYISWYETIENHIKEHKIGPFYTARPDGKNTYQVQTESLRFERITVPKNHMLLAII